MQILSDGEKVTEAINLALSYGGIDGAHHKMWVIDQMLRVLAGSNYSNLIKEYEGEEDEDGDREYLWDCGIAP